MDRRSIGLIHTWPKTRNAEYEVIQRIKGAAANIGISVIVIDNDGYILPEDENAEAVPRRLSADDCEFLISLHFESPRIIDIYSYVALWNPPSIFFLFDYVRSREQLGSHNDFLSCRSDLADSHAFTVVAGLGRTMQLPLPLLFHSVPEPYLAPRITDQARLFYVGINWERLRGASRHQELLEQLENDDLIDIYGPTKFEGIEPWAGFRNYKGEIPFDGRSVVEKINASGICLAFSSSGHQAAGVMSNRLFEGLAAGSIIIANRHPLIDKFFKDCVYVIDDELQGEEIVRQVKSIIEEVRSNPDAANERARLGQQRLKEKFSLEASLSALLAGHAERTKTFETAFLGGMERPKVCVITIYLGSRTAAVLEMLENISRQKNVSAEIILICDRGFYEKNKPAIDGALASICPDVKVMTEQLFATTELARDEVKDRRAACGPLVARAFAHAQSDYVIVLQPGQTWFADHLVSLAGALRTQPESYVACCGKIVETLTEGESHRHLDSLTCAKLGDLIEAKAEDPSGRFLFRRNLIDLTPRHLFELLDTLEHRALALWGILSGPLAQTNYATLVEEDQALSFACSDFIAKDHQIEFIRDSVRGNSKWIELRPRYQAPVPIPVFVPAPPAPLTLCRIVKKRYAEFLCTMGKALGSFGDSSPVRQISISMEKSGRRMFSEL